MHACPHCQQKLDRKLVWKTLFTGQVAHHCPACNERFRLTYAAKRRVAFLNMILIIGLLVSLNIPDVIRNLIIYGFIVVAVLIALPTQARYETLSSPEH